MDNNDMYNNFNQDFNQEFNQDEYNVIPSNGNMWVSVVSLVCGILSILCCCIFYISPIFAIAGLVFGIIAIAKKYDGRGVAIGGTVCSVIGILLFIIYIVLIFIGLSITKTNPGIIDTIPFETMPF